MTIAVLLRMICLFFCLMILSAVLRPAGAAEGDFSRVENAVLYQITDGVLEYNVTHSAPLAVNVAVTTPNGNTTERLRELLGTADAPKPVCGTASRGRSIGPAVRADLTLDAEGSVTAVKVTQISPRPIIGISWKRKVVNPAYQRLAQAFERGGALAVFLPRITGVAVADRVLSRVDGVFVSGGADWDPTLYGQTQSPHGAQNWHRLRDQSDICLISRALARDVPLLCVCRGEQGMNIARGGALIQDVPGYLGQKVFAGEIPPERVSAVLSGTLPGSGESVRDTGYLLYSDRNEKLGQTFDAETGTYMDGCGCKEGHLRVEVDGIAHRGGTACHPVRSGADGFGVARDSKWLYDIVGSECLTLVPTSHHQAVDPDRLGDGITVAAVNADGIIEAIEYPRNTFALGLQWHPERCALENHCGEGVDQDQCNALLGALIRHAGKRPPCRRHDRVL